MCRIKLHSRSYGLTPAVHRKNKKKRETYCGSLALYNLATGVCTHTTRGDRLLGYLLANSNKIDGAAHKW